MAEQQDDRVWLGRNQWRLTVDALEGLLNLLVVDWTAAVPEVKDPWEGAGVVTVEGKRVGSGTGEVWNAINNARGVLGASKEWVK